MDAMVEFAPMQPAPGHLSREDWTKLLLGVTLLFGLAVRIFPPMLVGFPINDGGMFLVMIRELRVNSFLLPALTNYNLSSIPFAYPPLGFYAAGLLSAVGMPELSVLTWLPAVVNAASIPVFFLLARALLRNREQAAVATMIYALVPGNYAWQIMGGGLTRSFGILFLLLALYSVLQMFQQRSWRYVGLSAVWCSLAVLSHPEVSLATATSCALFWAFFGLNRDGSLRAAVTSLGVVLLTSPWWGAVLAANGFSPFLSVVHSGAYISNPVKGLLLDVFKLNWWTGLFHLFYLAGMGWNLYRRQFFLPAWMLLPYFVEPRSAPAFAYFPQSILAAQALLIVLPAILERVKRRTSPEARSDLAARGGFQFGVLSLTLLWFLQSGFYGYVLANTSLQPPEPLEAMSWVKAHSPGDSRFLILTGRGGIMSDPIQEWFPALADRQSMTTLQGLEWTLGERFFPRLKELIELQDCADLECVKAWSAQTGLSYTHLMVEKNKAMKTLIQSAAGDPEFVPVFENSRYTIFEKARGLKAGTPK
jgi:hypothetical protein